MTYIVERLRDQAHMTQRDGLASMLETAASAADEIERLRKALEKIDSGCTASREDVDNQTVKWMRAIAHAALENKP